MNEHQKTADNNPVAKYDFCHYVKRMADICELSPDLFFDEMLREAQARPHGSIKLDTISPERPKKKWRQS